MKTNFRKYLALSVCLLAMQLMRTSAAWAISLDQAKSSGLVGEQLDGYLGAVNTPSAEIKALVEEINQKRKAKYQEIAQKNGTTVTAVEVLAARKAIQGTQAGNYIQTAPGVWAKK